MANTHAGLFLAEADFAEKVERSPVPVLVDFFADWCGPCRMIAPAVVELAAEYAGRAGVFKANVDDCPGLAARFNIRNIPTLIVFKAGKPFRQIVGAVPKEALAEALNEAIAAE
jgi:thioredoxin